MKKIVSMLLVVVLLVSAMSVCAFAADDSSNDGFIDSILNGVYGDDYAKMLQDFIASQDKDLAAAMEAAMKALGSNADVDSAMAALDKVLKDNGLDEKAIKDFEEMLNAYVNGKGIEDVVKMIKSGNYDPSAIKAILEKITGKKIDNKDLDKVISEIKNTDFSKFTSEEIINKIITIINGGNGTVKPEGDDVIALEDVSFDTVNHNAYVKGYDDGSFGPEKSITRAETAQMIYNLLSKETIEKYGSNNAAAKFSDVNASAWYNVAVSTLVSTGAISGYTDNTFKPNQQITRAEFVKMVMSIAGISASATPSFSDTATNAWYSPAVGTAQKAGYVEGSGGAFRPTDNMTRAEAVTFLNRVLGRAADTAYIGNHLNTVKSFTDVSVNAWYYKAVMEAANGHTYSVANNTETWTAIK